jgi:hypothetical protein
MKVNRGGLGSKGLCAHPFKKFQKASKMSPKGDIFEVLFRRLQNSLRPISHCHYGQSALEGKKKIRERVGCFATDSGKSNEFNITTHHLFIDFKAEYDTIMMALLRCLT